jgi:hypothetical protein
MGCLSDLPRPEAKWYPELPESNVKRRNLALRTAVNHNFRVDWDRYPDDPDFIVLADTEGNRFCIVNLGHEYPLPGPASPG